jgi:hypothetical protein
VLIGVILIHRLILSHFLPFSGDEAYHWEWSRHLALGYYDHPPMTAWLIKIVTLILGTSVFSARFTAFLCVAFSIFFTYRLTNLIAGKRAAVISIFLFLATPIYAGLTIMITTDPPLLMFWSGSLYFLYLAIFKDSRYFIPAGIFVGGALLCKFLAVHLLTSLGVFILFSNLRFKILSNKYFYLFIIITIVTFSPHIYWNYNHSWATFAFNFSKRHTLGFNLRFLFDYVLVQFLIIGITTSVLYIFTVFRNLKSWKFLKDNETLFLFSYTFVVLLFFAAISVSRRVGAHWPTGAYLAMIPLASVYASTMVRRRLLYVTIAVPTVLLLIATIPLLFPHKIPTDLSYGLQKKARTERLIHFYGWKEAAKTLNSHLDTMPKDSKIIGESYGVASIMAMYSGRNVSSHVLNLYGIHGLNYYFWDKFKNTKGISGVYVTATNKEKSPTLTKREADSLARSFKRYEILEPLKILIDGKHVRTFLFVKCFDLIAPLTEEKSILSL